MHSLQANGLTATAEDTGCPRIVVLSGRLDAVSQASAEQFLEAVTASGAKRIVLDCAGIEFISSAGIRPLLTLVKRVKPLGGGVSVCAARPHVRQLLEFSGLKSLLSIADSVDGGCAALSR